MEEKKLTDEEIVKALECCANGGSQKDCDLCPIGVIKCFEQENLMPQLALDLINRLKEGRKTFFRIAKQRNEEKRELEKKVEELQTEIERLKEENEYLDMVAKQALTGYQNTQVQVDELTEKLGKVLSGIKADELLVAKGIEQAVKDTAKEIFEKLLGYMGSQQQFCIVDEEHKTLIDCDKLFDFVGKLAKEKGVEVE